MAVQDAPIKVDPYQSTVPLVQLPVEQNAGQPAAPLQGNFLKKGTGTLAIGDALHKGFMQGHAIKEQRKYAQATAEMNAGQAAEQGAFQKYQSVLQQANGNVNDPNAQEAYKAYIGLYDRNTKAMEQYEVHDRKGKKPAGGQKPGKDDKPKSFGEKIMGFFEANPHMVPQLAVLARETGKLPPGLSREGQVQNLDYQKKQQELEAAKLEYQNADEDIKKKTQMRQDRMFVSQMDGKPGLSPEQQSELDAAKKRLEMEQTKTPKVRMWTNGKGDYLPLPENETPPANSGYYPYEKPSTATAHPNLSTEEMTAYAKSLNKTVDQVTDEEWQNYEKRKVGDRQVGSQTKTASTRDEHGNVETVSTRTPLPSKQSSLPTPRPGTSAGPMQRPQASAAPKTATDHRPTALPVGKAGGKKTLVDANREQARDTKHETGTAAAYKEYSDKIAYNNSHIADAGQREAANKQVTAAYQAKIWQNEKNFHKGEKMHLAKNGKVTVGSFDGKTWYNIETGEPIQ